MSAAAPQVRTLVLLRHGETTWNAAHRIQGQVDSPLSERGHDQARAVAPLVAALRPTVLRTSDLQRAAGTAAYVGAACGLEPRADRRLREFGLGEREGVTHEEYAERWPDEYADFATGRWSSVPGAEPLVDVRARLEECLAEVAEETRPGEVALAVAHGAALRVAVEALVQGTHTEPSAFAGMGNCGYAVLRERPGRRAGEPRWRLLAYDRRAAPAGA